MGLGLTTEVNALIGNMEYLYTRLKQWIDLDEYPVGITETQRAGILNDIKTIQTSKLNLITAIDEKRDSSTIKQNELYNAVRITQEKGIQVLDNLENERVKIGNYTTGKYGLLIKDSSGNKTILDEDGILQTWQEGRADNVAKNKPLILNIYLPFGTRSINQAILRFKRQAFRTYSVGVSTASSTIGTSGSSSSSTTSSGGDHRHSVFNYVGTVSENLYLGTQAYEFRMGTSTGSNGANFFIKSPGGTSQLYTKGASGDHSHGMSHTHSVLIPSHNHDISYGIYESSLPTNITVKINGINRTSALGGQTGFNSDQDNLDITSYLSIGQWNIIEMDSSTLGRIDATIFLQALMNVI